MKLSMIVAAAENGAIGLNNGLPWKLPEDMKYFKEKTMGNVVIMGGKTYESFKDKFPNGLPGRVNIVISRGISKGCFNEDKQTYLYFVESPLDAVLLANYIYNTPNMESYPGINLIPQIFIIGGKSIYDKFLAADIIEFIYYTVVQQNPLQYDTTISVPFENFNLVSETPSEKCTFQVWERDRIKKI